MCACSAMMLKLEQNKTSKITTWNQMLLLQCYHLTSQGITDYFEEENKEAERACEASRYRISPFKLLSW